jgi:pilus retraction protein PilT
MTALARDWGASDIFIAEGQPVRLKVKGVFHEREGAIATRDDLTALFRACGAEAGREHDLDASWLAPCGVRFRVNIHRRGGGLGAVLRQISAQVPTMETLGLPAKLLMEWLQHRAGLILVTGPTGCGKSTTVASCLDWLSSLRAGHIVTIEDPIEYLFTDRLGFFTQREIGQDTPSFGAGLFHAARQAPDTIFLGEIRDAESAIACLNAAETGHLVLSTLHAANVAETIDRLTGLIAPPEREGFLTQFANQAIGIISQRLLKSADQRTIVPIIEYVTVQGAVRSWIRAKDTEAIATHLRRTDDPQQRNFLRALCEAYHEGKLSYETALGHAANPVEFNRALRGVS